MITEESEYDKLLSERDRIENRLWFRPQDCEDLLHVEQKMHRGDFEDTSETRKEIWDELLKFTKYKTVVKINGDVRVDNTDWSQSSVDAHNDAVNEIAQSERIDNDVDVNQIPLERFYPDIDPLPDLEEFVYHV